VIALSLNSVYFNLDEVIFFLKGGDFSIFDFYSDYSEKDAVVYMKGTGCLYICNVSDDVIPEETVRLVIEVLEHLDEYLKQAYDKLVLWDWKHHKWGSGNESFTHDPKKVFELESDQCSGNCSWTVSERCRSAKNGNSDRYLPFSSSLRRMDCVDSGRLSD